MLFRSAGRDPSEEAFRMEQSDLKHFLARHHVTPHMLVRDAWHDTGHDLLALAREAGCSLRTARRLVAQHRAATGRAPAPEGRPRKWAPRVPI